MKDCINIGLLGVGTVGSGVLHVLEHNSGEIAKKAGCKIEIKKILVRNPQKAAELGKKYAVTGDFEDIVNDPDIDIVVELIGREHPAKEYIASALEHGKKCCYGQQGCAGKIWQGAVSAGGAAQC